MIESPQCCLLSLVISIASALRSELGHSDALGVGMVVLKMKSVTLESKVLHAVIVEGANSFDIGSFSQLLEVFFVLVEGDDLLDAVEVVTNVVLVFEHTEGSVNLIFVL